MLRKLIGCGDRAIWGVQPIDLGYCAPKENNDDDGHHDHDYNELPGVPKDSY